MLSGKGMSQLCSSVARGDCRRRYSSSASRAGLPVPVSMGLPAQTPQACLHPTVLHGSAMPVLLCGTAEAPAFATHSAPNCNCTGPGGTSAASSGAALLVTSPQSCDVQSL